MQDLRVYPTEFRDSSIANLDHWLMTQGRKRVCQGLCLLTRELPSPRVKEIRKKKSQSPESVSRNGGDSAEVILLNNIFLL